MSDKRVNYWFVALAIVGLAAAAPAIWFATGRITIHANSDRAFAKRFTTVFRTEVPVGVALPSSESFGVVDTTIFLSFSAPNDVVESLIAHRGLTMVEPGLHQARVDEATGTTNLEIVFPSFASLTETWKNNAVPIEDPEMYVVGDSEFDGIVQLLWIKRHGKVFVLYMGG